MPHFSQRNTLSLPPPELATADVFSRGYMSPSVVPCFLFRQILCLTSSRLAFLCTYYSGSLPVDRTLFTHLARVSWFALLENYYGLQFTTTVSLSFQVLGRFIPLSFGGYFLAMIVK